MSKTGGDCVGDQRERLKEFVNKIDKLQKEYDIEIVSDNQLFYDRKRDVFLELETEIVYPRK